MAIELNWQQFFLPGSSVQNVVTTMAQSSSAVSALTLTPMSAITRIVPSTSGLGTTCTFTSIALPYPNFQGPIRVIIASTSITIATSSSGGGATGFNLGSTLVGYKEIEFVNDGTGWNPSY